MTPDPKGTTQACRLYAILLRCYPLPFQQEYGDTLVLQFRDEYLDVQSIGSSRSLFRFWCFILFDFFHSLLRECREEVVKMFKKNLFVFSAILAGLATLLMIPSEYQGFPLHEKLDMWSQLLFDPLFIGFGALALFGIATVTKSHLIFKVLPLVMLSFAVSTIPIPSLDPTLGWVGRPAFTYLFSNEYGILGFFIAMYLLLTAIISITAFAKKKWLPGVCLLVINLLLLIPNVAYSLSEDSPIVEHTWGENWYLFSLIGIYLIAWFTIAWWLYNRNMETPNQEVLENV